MPEIISVIRICGVFWHLRKTPQMRRRKKDKKITGVGFKLEISVLPSAALSTVSTWPLQEFGSKNYIEYKVNFYGQLFVGVAKTRVRWSSSTRTTSGTSGASITPISRSGGTG